VAAERARLVASARAGTLEPRDLATGSVTLSNLGAYPVDFFAPVVTGPQIATVATGRMVRKPVAVGDAIGLGARLTVDVAIDHRGADGAAGGRLLAALERRLAALTAHV
jgi:pyruvate dehydrogenase E2 component (dihydrolipoamide acetyltransferase)